MRESITTPAFDALVEDVRGDRTHRDIEAGFRRLVLTLAQDREVSSILEVGGGRRPLLDRDEVAGLGVTYTVNDVDARELSLAPEWVSTLTGDISEDAIVEAGRRFDLVAAQWVFEHIAEPAGAYANVHRMLTPGGVCVVMVPTLFASPFVINHIIPERLSAAVLKRAFPHRDDHDIPKFPAYYRWCRADERTRRRLLGVGFESARIVPFYGHGYYATIPGLAALQDRWTQVASEHEWSVGTAYAIIIAQKGHAPTSS